MKAKYFDGIKPVSKEVTCEKNPQSLLITLENGEKLPDWQLSDIEQDENVNTALVIKNRLTGESLEFYAEPQEILPLIRRERVSFKAKIFAGMIAGVALLLMAFWQLLPFFSKKMAKLISHELEEKISRQLEISVSKDLKLCNPSRESSQAIDKFLSRLNAKNIKLTVANDPTVNAYTFPGGKIIIFRGLIEKTQTPEELAGILAHEMGHVEERHILQKVLNALSIAAIFHLIAGDFSSAFAIDPSTLLSIAALSFDRGMEEEADQRARDRLEANAIRFKDVANFFQRSSRNPDRYSVFTTHPGDEARQHFFLSKKQGKTTPMLTKMEWKKLRHYCEPIFLKKDSNKPLSERRSQSLSPWEKAREKQKLDFPIRF